MRQSTSRARRSTRAGWPDVALHSRTRGAGAALLVIIVGFGLVGPLVIASSPVAQDLNHVLQTPGSAHLLGTDHLGRDVLARLAHAVRLSVVLAIVGVAFAATVGTTLGLLAAWRGGWVERLLVTAADAVLAL